MRKRYRRKAGHLVEAVQLNLETSGFTYQKWGSEQRCQKGDWLVNNGGDTYTVDCEVFKRTYKRVGAGQYCKITVIWAEIALEDGAVATKEGTSHYFAGDFIVSNDEEGMDAYCISADKFHTLYELVS